MLGSIRDKRTRFLNSVSMKAALAALIGPHNLLSLLSAKQTADHRAGGVCEHTLPPPPKNSIGP